MQQQLRKQNDVPRPFWSTGTVLMCHVCPARFTAQSMKTKVDWGAVVERPTQTRWFDFSPQTKTKNLCKLWKSTANWAVHVYITAYVRFHECCVSTTNFMCDWVLEMCWAESIFRAHLFTMRFMSQNANNLFWITKAKSPSTLVTPGRTDLSESISLRFFPPRHCFPPS